MLNPFIESFVRKFFGHVLFVSWLATTLLNATIEQTTASLFAQPQIEPQRRLAPAAHRADAMIPVDPFTELDPARETCPRFTFFVSCFGLT